MDMDIKAFNRYKKIGSDGIFSAVRRQLNFPGDRLNYVGLVVVLGIVEEKIMKVLLAKRRIFETVDGAARIYAMPFTTTSTMWQLSFPCTEQAARAYMKDTASLKEEIVRKCASWHEPIPELLRNTPLDCMSGYPVYDRGLLQPDTLRPSAQTRRRVTLIGDAAHPMTPFKAQGANQAIEDAVLLANSLVQGVAKHGPLDGFDAALPQFETKMLNRSARVVAGSRDKAKEMHSALALQPARKAQREADVDMRKTIQVLRVKGIGAASARDPRGLDAVVQAEAGHAADAAATWFENETLYGKHYAASAPTNSSKPQKTIFEDKAARADDSKKEGDDETAANEKKRKRIGENDGEKKKSKKKKKEKKEKKEKKRNTHEAAAAKQAAKQAEKAAAHTAKTKKKATKRAAKQAAAEAAEKKRKPDAVAEGEKGQTEAQKQKKEKKDKKEKEKGKRDT